jgi:glucokinase
MDLFLAIDVGGTKIHLALGRFEGNRFIKLREAKAATGETSDFPALVREFAGAQTKQLAAAAVGIAGPVIEDRVHGANLPWDVERLTLSRALGGTPVRLLNDLVASGYGVSLLQEKELAVLQEGVRREGNRALISPGTGLGECILLWDGRSHLPVSSEAGHGDFAARTDDEILLLRHLRDRFGRASAERVVSGPGLVNVFEWLRESGRVEDDSGLAGKEGDLAQEISQRALAGSSRICRDALTMWSQALAAEAGNVALRGLATGGVYLGGGIPAKVLPYLRGRDFLNAFCAKQPQEKILREIPIAVIMSQETTLTGAAAAARALAELSPHQAPAQR